MRTVLFAVEGMVCDACATRIAKVLRRIDGVAEVDVGLARGQVAITYRPEKLAPTQLAAAVRGLGYRVGKPIEVRHATA